MNIPSRTIIITSTALFLLFGIAPFLSQALSWNFFGLKKSDSVSREKTESFSSGGESQGSSSASKKQEKEELTALQQQARMYRAQGLAAQRIGDLQQAFIFYQKAATLDPGYALVFNDLGILYEAQGYYDAAEQCYLKAAQIDPDYLSVYSNLALLYENKRQFEKASAYWKKRIELGAPDDPWTQKARQRYDDISLVLSEGFLNGDNRGPARERDVVDLLKDVANRKYLERKDNKELAKSYFEQAKLYYRKGQEVAAFKKAIDAKQLDPANTEIQEFIDKVQIRLLSK